MLFVALTLRQEWTNYINPVKTDMRHKAETFKFRGPVGDLQIMHLGFG